MNDDHNSIYNVYIKYIKKLQKRRTNKFQVNTLTIPCFLLYTCIMYHIHGYDTCIYLEKKKETHKSFTCTYRRIKGLHQIQIFSFNRIRHVALIQCEPQLTRTNIIRHLLKFRFVVIAFVIITTLLLVMTLLHIGNHTIIGTLAFVGR